MCLKDEESMKMKYHETIYEDPSNDDLLYRCIDGFNKNSNESFNQVVWKISPKTMCRSSTIVEIAACVAAFIFNKDTHTLIINILGTNCGSNSHRYTERKDS